MTSGPSSEAPQTVVYMLNEALANERAVERRLADIGMQNERLGTHLNEVKAIVQSQRELPPQVLLQRPVILIDAFDGRPLPFHLDFIDSLEALVAVFMIRFRDKGATALDRIHQHDFCTYEHSKQRLINTRAPWSKVFKVSRKEPSMLGNFY
jgi:hypothetical protein